MFFQRVQEPKVIILTIGLGINFNFADGENCSFGLLYLYLYCVTPHIRLISISALNAPYRYLCPESFTSCESTFQSFAEKKYEAKFNKMHGVR